MKTDREYEFRVSCECNHCYKQIRGLLFVDGDLNVVDSPGFWLFPDGIMCDKCIKKMGMQNPHPPAFCE